MRLLVILIALLLLGSLAYRNSEAIFVEQHEIKSGSYTGLTIGMEPAQVLAAIKTLGAKVVAPAACQKFQMFGSDPRKFPPFSDLEGVRVTDRRSAFVDIYFSDGRVSRIARMTGSDLARAVTVGEDADLVRKELIRTIEADNDLTVAPIVDFEVNGILKLNAMTSADQLRSHWCWRFEINSVKPAGAVYEIEFAAGRLRTISYRRSRIRID